MKINFQALKNDLPFMTDDELNDEINVYLVNSFQCKLNNFDARDCRKAVNMCIQEYKNRWRKNDGFNERGEC
ncbi:hypothetical protein [Alkalihalobacillus sp. BA299]|uniref:hypothetical protein n=1 Tax=Alkalihalobacillus sp. BA299 TaxID=2815938 RepID=UPI001AD9C064|nr:hypothetical protein [Alkalihalobacillus sp. BA299]